MPVFELVKLDEKNYSVEGELSFFSINQQSIESFDFLKSTTEICIDLTQVTVADSAGLALLIELIKHSKQHDTKLVFKNIPEQLLTLARLCDFENSQYFIYS